MEALPNFFGNAGGQQSAEETGMDVDGEEVLCVIRCGRLHKVENKMKPDPTKGKLRVVRGIDSLTRLQYGERNPSTPFEPSEDIIIFPQECLSKMMKQPNCFALKFIEDSSRDMYFWFQEKGEEDVKKELLQKLNEMLNQTEPTHGGGMGGGGHQPMDEPDFEQQLRDAIAASQMPPDTPVSEQQENGEQEQQTGQHKEGDEKNDAEMDMETPFVGASNTAPKAPQKEKDATTLPGGVGTSATASEMAAAMAATMSGIRVPAFGEMTPLQQQQQQQQNGGSLRDVLKPEIVGPILRNKEVRDRLLVHLPEEHRETADLEELIQTPQFRSQLERFSEALQTGQMDLGQFGLKAETNSPIADLRTFLKAIQEQVKEKESEGKSGGADAME
jgi:hypothetical protein